MRDHRKLRAFELADALVVAVYEATKEFPAGERWGLVSQMRRAAVSAPTNIVEGCGRNTENEYVHFLGQALGSLRETGYLVDLSWRLGYLPEPASRSIPELYEQAAATLTALIRSLRRDETGAPSKQR
jgi:four helix bundle protein